MMSQGLRSGWPAERRGWRTAAVAVAAGLVIASASGCGPLEGDDFGAGPATGGKTDGVAVDPALAARIGTVFLREQFVADAYSSVRQSIRNDPPGGIVFWNGASAADRRSAAQLRRVIVDYSRAAREAGHLPLLMSTDYEGGQLGYHTNGTRIAGIQRFTDGMTALAHPRWIGVAYRADPALGRELALLHGRIIAREMASVGINYPLSVISDLAQKLFSVRGVDGDEQIVAELMRQVLDGFAAEPGVVLVTKHFPGLGQTVGDTHDMLVVAQGGLDVIERHLTPFRALVAHAQRTSATARLSLMCGHAMFPALDAEHNTTVSRTLLGELLRQGGEQLPLQPLGFDGIAVSDAMWMGPYGQMGWEALRRVYVAALVAGLDLLMIPGANFDRAVAYFRDLYLQRLAPAEQRALEQQLGMPWGDLHATFAARLAESVARIDLVRHGLGHGVDTVDADGVAPSARTAADRARYREILVMVDARWRSWLP